MRGSKYGHETRDKEGKWAMGGKYKQGRFK